MRIAGVIAGTGLLLPIVGVGSLARAQPFSGSAGWGTIGVTQTVNPAVCSFFNQFGGYQYPNNNDQAPPEPVRETYPASLVGTGSFFAINFSTPVAGASVEFESNGTASVVIAGSSEAPGNNPPPVVTYGVGSYSGGVTQQGGIEFTNIVFSYTLANGDICSTQLYGTFFATPSGG